MLYALVDQTRVRPLKGMHGNCPACDGDVIAKCGEIKIHHWAHVSANCDPWQIGKESAWHLAMKDLYERIYGAKLEQTIIKDGILHRADAVLPDGTVVEFQNSALSTIKIREREEFYDNMVWVWNTLDRFTLTPWGTINDMLYAWKRPHKAVKSCTKPVYFDLNGNMNPLIVEYGSRRSSYGFIESHLVHLGEWEGFTAWNERLDREAAEKAVALALEQYHGGNGLMLMLTCPELYRELEADREKAAHEATEAMQRELDNINEQARVMWDEDALKRLKSAQEATAEKRRQKKEFRDQELWDIQKRNERLAEEEKARRNVVYVPRENSGGLRPLIELMPGIGA